MHPTYQVPQLFLITIHSYFMITKCLLFFNHIHCWNLNDGTFFLQKQNFLTFPSTVMLFVIKRLITNCDCKLPSDVNWGRGTKTIPCCSSLLEWHNRYTRLQTARLWVWPPCSAELSVFPVPMSASFTLAYIPVHMVILAPLEYLLCSRTSELTNTAPGPEANKWHLQMFPAG